MPAGQTGLPVVRGLPPPEKQLVVIAKLVEVTPTPSPDRIGQYRRCLAAYTYDVQQVLQGACRERRILVAHWVIIDRRVLPVSRRVGQSYRLRLVLLDDYPQLQVERLVMTQDEVHLPLYYDTGS